MSSRRRVQKAAEVLNQAAQDQDAEYFNTHPDAKIYRRLATADECRASGLPPGTWVIVGLVGPNTRVRAFYPPDARSN